MTVPAREASAREQCVVAVPVYRSFLTEEEEVSWRHLLHFLGDREIRLFLPEGLESPKPEMREERFPARFFDSVASYSRLLLSEDFYRRFSAFEFLLIYQLDALVFSSALDRWCEAGYDYLGAPWWKDPDRPELGLSHTGNGGLSLRRVAAALEVLTADARPGPLPVELMKTQMPDLQGLPPARKLRRKVRILREARQGARWYTDRYSLNEDRFWSDRAHLFLRSFRTAPPHEALEFSFEVAPRAAFELNGARLPFGCHGWWRYDREAWAPYLLPAGESAAPAAARAAR